jgi:hypothetical protein
MEKEFRDVLDKLVAEGKIKLVGRTASGNAVYAATQEPNLARKSGGVLGSRCFFQPGSPN